ncbi:MAG TPA: hypothetical protein VK797_24260 [Tepidisphaeraceae bacterium]|jgi:hypothetical protein|nr:hypothetical protein [Tepidisphaeraceae bacterium]
MEVELKRPELERFILDQVRAGHFPSAGAAVEAAIEQMMCEYTDLDDESVAAIERADAQYEAGQVVEWRNVRDELRKKYLGK